MVTENSPRSQSHILKDLCQRVEETAGICATTPAKFEALAEAIFKRTGKLLSSTTLKRIWGYLREPMNTRRSTLDILAIFCGWQNYDDFAVGHIPEIESGTVGTPVLHASTDVARGDRIKLMWAPARVCVIEYLGDMEWRVMASEGTRLKPGDTFTCPIIVTGEPLYLDNLVHEGARPGVYVCGRKSGVSFIVGVRD